MSLEASTAPPALASADTIEVHFAPRAPDISLYEVKQRGLRLLCTGHCAIPLARGTHSLALSRFGRKPVATGPIALANDVTLEGRYRSRKGMRATGWILAGLGIAAVAYGIGNMAAFALDEGDTPAYVAPMAAGTALVVTGLLLALLGDDKAYVGATGVMSR